MVQVREERIPFYMQRVGNDQVVLNTDSRQSFLIEEWNEQNCEYITHGLIQTNDWLSAKLCVSLLGKRVN